MINLFKYLVLTTYTICWEGKIQELLAHLLTEHHVYISKRHIPKASPLPRRGKNPCETKAASGTRYSPKRKKKMEMEVEYT